MFDVLYFQMNIEHRTLNIERRKKKRRTLTLPLPEYRGEGVENSPPYQHRRGVIRELIRAGEMDDGGEKLRNRIRIRAARAERSLYASHVEVRFAHASGAFGREAELLDDAVAYHQHAAVFRQGDRFGLIRCVFRHADALTILLDFDKLLA